LFSSAKAAICSACGLQGDIQGDRLLFCATMGRYARHNALRDALARSPRRLVCIAEWSVSEEPRERPGDVLLRSYDDGFDLAVEVSVVHSLQLTTDFDLSSEMVFARREAQELAHTSELCA